MAMFVAIDIESVGAWALHSARLAIEKGQIDHHSVRKMLYADVMICLMLHDMPPVDRHLSLQCLDFYTSQENDIRWT